METEKELDPIPCNLNEVAYLVEKAKCFNQQSIKGNYKLADGLRASLRFGVTELYKKCATFEQKLCTDQMAK